MECGLIFTKVTNIYKQDYPVGYIDKPWNSVPPPQWQEPTFMESSHSTKSSLFIDSMSNWTDEYLKVEMMVTISSYMQITTLDRSSSEISF